jgi:subtilisin family serine protease/sugar lactone lactonase YvrE
MAGARPKGKDMRHAAASTTLLFVLIASLTVLLAPSAGAAPALDRLPGQQLGPEPPRLGSPRPAADEPSSENGAIIPNHYIVVLEDSVAHPGALAESQTESHDGELGFVYRYGMKGYSAELSKQAAEELRDNPKVKYVTPDRVVTTQSQTIPTGIRRTYATQNPTAEIDGVDKRVNADVAVIDSGIDYEHPDLNVYKRTNCVPADENPSGSEESVESCADNTGTDGNGHGTHVAGIIGALDNEEGVVGMAPGARLWAVRVLNNEGKGSLSWIIAGVNWVTAHAGEIEVANMSLGCPCSAPALETAIDGSIEAGVVYVVAAGNEHRDVSTFSPAKNPNAITVSALADYDGRPGGERSPTCINYGEDDHLASFSNYGKGVDIAAPGVCIESTYKNGGYATLSGTSMASPHVAGAAALLASRSNPENGEDVKAIAERLEEEGNYEWTDNSGDGVKEPLLDTGEWTALTDGYDLVTGSEPEATLHGRVNPRGLETSYRFEYDTAPYEAGKEGHGTSIPVPDAAAGSGSKYVPVSKTLTGLANRQTYHYRLVASNSNGTFYGADREFATTPPAARSGEADEVHANDANLRGVVNPEGAKTTFRFQFGADTSYGRTATATTDTGSETSASGTEDVNVSAVVGGLAPNRTYHFRLIAENLAGTSYGEDQTFTTGPSEWHAQPTPVPGGQRNGLSDVSCVSRSSCMAVGNDGELFTPEGFSARWDGGEWSLDSMPKVEGAERVYPEHVSCASEHWCMAVGSTFSGGQFTALAERWNGKEWTVDSLPLATGTIESELLDVSCTSTSACTAVGYYEKEDGKYYLLAERWNGTKWARQSPLALGKEHRVEALQSVSCVDASYCVVVGWYEDEFKAGGGAELWSSTGWAKIPGLSESLLRHVSCPLRNACTAVGVMHETEVGAAHWDGKGWSAPESLPLAPGTSETRFYDMACPEADSCTLVGTSSAGGYPAPFAARWEGGEWSVQSTAEPAQEGGLSYPQAELGGVSCPSPSWCVGAGIYVSQSLGTGMVETYQAPGPDSLTKPATHIGSSRATLNASIDPQGKETTYRFEYGEDKAYGSEIPASPEAIGSGKEGVEVAQVLKGLKPQTIYHYRVAATNSEGTTYGEDRSFTTLAVAPAFSLSVGKSGSGEGQLSEPRGIALDSKDQVWVADSGNSRISKFDHAGKPLATYGAKGSALGQFGESSPAAIAVDPEGNVWAADTSNNRLQELNSEGKFLKAVGWGVKDGSAKLELCESSCQAGIAGSGQGQLDHPQGMALDAKGNVWVADSANNRLEEFNPKGEYLGQLKTTASATDLAFDAEGDIWVAEPSRNRIARYSPAGELLIEAGSEGTGNGQFKAPSGIGMNEGNVWVADSENNRVQILNPKGEYLASFGEAGSGEGQLSYPRDVAFDSEGNAWVSDSHNSRIQKWIYPEAPKAITEAATEVKKASATLHGTLNPEGAATSYYFEYGKTSTYGSKSPTTPATVPAGSANVVVSQTPTGLSQGTTYHFRLVASNAGGTTYGEDETLRTIGPPKAITEAATEVKATQATLNGTVNPEGSATTYYFEYDESEYKAGEGSHGTKIPTSPAAVGSGTSNLAVSQTPTDLKAGTTYHFRLVAENAIGTTKGEDKTLSTLKAPQATTEAATSVKETSATLNGTVNPEGSTTIYYFEYDTSEYKEGEGPHGTRTKGKGAFGTSNVAASQALTVLKAGTTYHFRVVAEGATTVFGKDKEFTTLGSPNPPKATTEAATSVKATSATLNGTVNPEGSSTSYYFEYGKTNSYGTKVPVSAKSAGSGSSNVAVSEALSGLEPGTAYHFQVVAEGGGVPVSGGDKEFTTAKPPKATTEAATSVKATSATLNGTVNPEGSSTSYYFEYGKTTSYGTKVPASPKSAGSGSSNVAVSEALSGLEPGTAYHFQVVAEGGGVPVSGGDKEFTTANTAAEIGVLPTLDALNRSETPLSNSGKWSALAWDTSTSGHNTGYDTTTGWGAYDAYPVLNGAYWNPSTFTDKTGDAAAVTMSAAPTSESRYLALWLDMGNPGSAKSGYQLRWIYNPGGTTYTVKLSKWSSGTETVLASNASVSIPTGTTVAISDTGGTVTAWETTGGSLTSILSASDTAFSEGYAGIEVSGQKSRLTNFKAGRLLGGAITGVSVLDDFGREERPLATSNWTQTGWTEEIGNSWSGGWHGYGARDSHLAGAYWNPTTFSDASGPLVVAATLGTGPRYAPDYLSLWLDMPNPGSARSGYEARVTGTNGYPTNYKVELSKWVSGTRTVLGTKEGFSLPVGTTMALTETGGTLTLWTGTSSFSPVLSATDSTYSSGYAGLEAYEGEGTEYDFRAGGL